MAKGKDKADKDSDDGGKPGKSGMIKIILGRGTAAGAGRGRGLWRFCRGPVRRRWRPIRA